MTKVYFTPDYDKDFNPKGLYIDEEGQDYVGDVYLTLKDVEALYLYIKEVFGYND